MRRTSLQILLFMLLGSHAACADFYTEESLYQDMISEDPTKSNGALEYIAAVGDMIIERTAVPQILSQICFPSQLSEGQLNDAVLLGLRSAIRNGAPLSGPGVFGVLAAFSIAFPCSTTGAKQ
jgi:hypothetical protein